MAERSRKRYRQGTLPWGSAASAVVQAASGNYGAAALYGAQAAARYFSSRHSQTVGTPALTGADHVIAVHDQLTTTGFTHVVNGPSPKFFKHKGTITYQQYCSGQLEWDIGRQGIQDCFQLYNTNILATQPIVAPIPTVGWVNPVFSFDPNIKTSGGGVISADVSPENRYIHLKTIKLDFELVNLTNKIACCTLYWCMAKKTGLRTPSEEWQEGLKDLRLGQSASSQYNSVTGTLATAGYPFNYYIGQSPSHVPAFKKCFKVIKRQTFQLQSGATLKDYVKIYMNKTVSKTYIDSLWTNVDGSAVADSYPNMVAGYTIVPMLVARSTPIWDDSTDVKEVTYGSGDIGWMCSQTFTFVPFSTEENVKFDRVWPTCHNAGTTTEKLVGDDDAEIAGVDIGS